MRAPTYKRTLVVSLGLNLWIYLCMAVWMIASPEPEIGEWPETPTVAEQLMAEHDCWQDGGPDGAFPEHAVVELDPRRGPELVPSDIGFDIWLGPDALPNTEDERGGTLFAFCP